MNPSILLAVWLLTGPVLAGDPASPPAQTAAPAAGAPVFNLKTAAPELRLVIDKYRAELQIIGFRFNDDTGELASPNTHSPASTAEVELYIEKIQFSRRQQAIERIADLLKDEKPGKPASPETMQRIRDIIKDTPDFPADLGKVLIGAQVGDAGAQHAEALAAYLKSWQASDAEIDMKARLDRTEPVATGWPNKPLLASYETAEERALGERLQRATIDYFGKYGTGREMLDHFRDERGQLRMPDMLVLKIQPFAGAFYSAANRAMVCNFEPVRAAIVANAPPDKQKALQERLKTAKDVNEYLAQEPGALQSFIETYDVTLYHEFTHAWQDKRQRLPAEQLRENAPGNDPIECEIEAFTNENRFLHEKLLKDPDAALRSGYLSYYTEMLSNYGQFRDAITRQYLQMMPAGAATLPEMKSIQGGRFDAVGGSMGIDADSIVKAALRLIGLARGSTALQEAQDDYSRRSDEFQRDELPRMRAEGGLALADAYAKRGERVSAMRFAYQAELSESAEPSLKARIDATSDRLAKDAFQSLDSDGVDAMDKAQIVYLLSQRRDQLHKGPEISTDQRTSAFLDVADDLMRRADRATDEASAKTLRNAARGWVDALGGVRPEALKDSALAGRLKAARFELERAPK